MQGGGYAVVFGTKGRGGSSHRDEEERELVKPPAHARRSPRLTANVTSATSLPWRGGLA